MFHSRIILVKRKNRKEKPKTGEISQYLGIPQLTDKGKFCFGHYILRISITCLFIKCVKKRVEFTSQLKADLLFTIAIYCHLVNGFPTKAETV